MGLGLLITVKVSQRFVLSLLDNDFSSGAVDERCHNLATIFDLDKSFEILIMKIAHRFSLER